MKENIKPEDMIILVVGDRAWGRGQTLDEALSQLKKAGGSKRCYIAYIAAPGTYIDEDGRTCFPQGNPPKYFHRVGVPEES